MKTTFNSWYIQKMRSDPEISEETDRAAELLAGVRTIAIVGISRNRHKDSYYVGKYLKNVGYRVIPVNPAADEILGEMAYPDLRSIPEPVDVVNIFRRPEDIPAVVEEALSIHPKVIWLQLGTGIHNETGKMITDAGIQFLQNRCIKVDHQFLIRPYKENAKSETKTISV